MTCLLFYLPRVFVASSGANVRALCVSAKGLGGMSDTLVVCSLVCSEVELLSVKFCHSLSGWSEMPENGVENSLKTKGACSCMG